MSEEKKAVEEKSKQDNNIAIIRIRGQTGIRREISDTLDMLKLKTKFSCVIVPNNPSYTGMIKKIKDFVTYGTIDDETLKDLESKRKEADKITYRLHPPRGGFESKGTKKAFIVGGALGNRKEKINDLLKRMM